MREGIDRLRKYFGCYTFDKKVLEKDRANIEDILRSHGWHHESDVVEGRTVEGDICPKWEIAVDNSGVCNNRPCPEGFGIPFCSNKRPATVKDIIG